MSYTYGELKQAIQDYCENQETSFVNNLNTFIESAEERIIKNVQLQIFRRNQSASLTASNQYLNLPSDFLAPFSLSITNGSNKQMLLYKDVNFLQEFAPDASSTGVPKYYAFFDDENLLIAPTPDSGYTVQLHYFYRPASLTSLSDSGTTWLSENAPQAMLYGSLLAAYTYMKGEPDVLQNYSQQFAESVARLKNLGESLEYTDAYRTGLINRPKT